MSDTNSVTKKWQQISIMICCHFWKGNHILIEFALMVSNRQTWLQTDTYGFKSEGTVSG